MVALVIVVTAKNVGCINPNSLRFRSIMKSCSINEKLILS